jgi:pyrroline-5-carboxylate reductase
MSYDLLTFGAGNMAQALIPPMVKGENLRVKAFTPSMTKAQELADKVNGSVLENLKNIPEVDFYMLSCKPQQFHALASEISGKLKGEGIALSLLAGITIEEISLGLSHEKVVRLMPNTPALVGEGITLIYFSPTINESEKELIKRLLSHTGSIFECESEDQLDRLMGLTGSGPAYIFEFARLFSEYLTHFNVPKEVAEKLCIDLFKGSSMMMDQSKENLETLRNKVTSPNGVTHEALEVFKNEKIGNIFNQALESNYQRAKELAGKKP